MKVLIVHDDDAAVAALARAVRARAPKLEIEHALELEAAHLTSVEVLVIQRAGDSLQFAAFAGSVHRQGVRVVMFHGFAGPRGMTRAEAESSANWNPLTPVPRVPLIRTGEVVTRVDVLEHGSPEAVAEQLVRVLGVERSQIADAVVIESLGSAGAADFKRVQWPGLQAPVLLVEALPYEAASCAAAQRASLVRGEGLAQTLEVFWEDPRPHLLQVLPEGVSLARRRKTMGVPTALSLVRGIAEGVATLHANDFASGGLDPSSIWLTDAGEVLLLGHGIIHLRPKSRAALRWGAPEELLARIPPRYGRAATTAIFDFSELPGDPFRLGAMVLDLAVAESPYDERFLMQRDWSIEQSAHRAELAPIADLLETLLHVDSVDRPRGALLREVIAAASPSNWKEYVAKLAKGQ